MHRLFPGRYFPRPLLSKYELLGFIGYGISATVYKVKRRADGAIRALKVPRFTGDDYSYFYRETAALTRLKGSGIVEMSGAYVLPVPHIELQYLDGVRVGFRTYRDMSYIKKPAGHGLARKVILKIAGDAIYARSKGVYHIDIQPSNIGIAAGYTPVLIDFHHSALSGADVVSIRPDGSLAISPDEGTHMPQDAYERMLVLSLARTFFELLTGREMGKLYPKYDRSSDDLEICQYFSLLDRSVGENENTIKSVEEFVDELKKCPPAISARS